MTRKAAPPPPVAEAPKPSPVKIRKAKIKDDLFLDVEYTEELPGHSKKDTKLSCTVPVHEDLKAAFQKLHKHLAILCDEVKVKGKDFEEFHHADLALFTARSFSIGGNDDSEGVTITGMKDGRYGIVNLNSPFTVWEDEDYPFTSELAEDVEACLYEVREYLFNGKRAPEKQLELGFSDEAAESEETE